MKKNRLLLLMLFLFAWFEFKAMTHEFYFYIKDSSGTAKARSIIIYRIDEYSKSYIPIASGTSYTNWITYDNYNAGCNIIEVPPAGANPNISPDIHFYYSYIIRIADKFVTLSYGGGTDAAITYITDLDSIIVENTLWNVTYHHGHWTDYSILLKNNFAGGSMGINEITETNIPSEGRTVYREGTTFPHTITAIDQQTPTDGYKRFWDKWSDTYANLGRNLNDPQNFDKTANFKKEFHVTFRNYYGSYGNTGGDIKVRGNQVNSPSVDNLVTEGLSISAEALNQTIDYVYLTIDYWSDNLGTNASVNPTPTDHKTYTAYLKGKPVNGYRNMSFNTNEENNPIEITWSKHPLDNSDVTQYAVYRKVTTSGTPTLLTTVSANGSSSYTYTDYDYAISSGENKILLFYDVRAYYSPSSTYADADFEAVYGIEYIRFNPNDLSQNITNVEIPEIYSVNNYPNPFNPTTTINYQIPEAGFVTLKVYDILGKEVVTLVNENKQAGYHSALFTINSSLSSGIYIYTFQCNGYKQSRKMLLTK